MNFLTAAEIMTYLGQQPRYADAANGLCLLGLGTAQDSDGCVGRSWGFVYSAECREIFIAMRATGEICGVQMSYALSASDPNVRKNLIQKIFEILTQDPELVNSAATKLIYGSAEHAQQNIVWVLPLDKFAKDNDKNHAVIKDVCGYLGNISSIDKMNIVQQLLRGACLIGNNKSVYDYTPPVADEPVMPSPPPASAQNNITAVQQSQNQRLTRLQKLVTGLCIGSVLAVTAFAGFIAAQSTMAVWKAIVHVAGLVATTMPVLATGILSMMAFDRIDDMIIRLSGKKIGLLPVKRTDKNDHTQQQWGQFRTQSWCYVKYGCVAMVGAASMVGFMRWDNGGIYQSTQKILLPANPAEKKPPVPFRESSYLRAIQQRQNTI